MYSFSNKRFSLSRSLLHRRKQKFLVFLSKQRAAFLFRFFTKLSVSKSSQWWCKKACRVLEIVSVCRASGALYKKEERKKKAEKNFDTQTLNQMFCVERSSPPCVLIERLGRFLHISRSILFPNNVIVSIQQTRAGSTQNRHAFIIINNTTIERERKDA